MLLEEGEFAYRFFTTDNELLTCSQLSPGRYFDAAPGEKLTAHRLEGGRLMVATETDAWLFEVTDTIKNFFLTDVLPRGAYEPKRRKDD